MASEETIKLRKRILNSVDGAPRSASQIAELLTRGGWPISASQVGNNLRYLQDGKFVEYQLNSMGKKLWIRGPNADSYTAEPYVSLFFEVPEKMNQELDRVAKKLKITKAQLVRESLEEQLGI